MIRPTRCLIEHPHSHSVYLAGVAINLKMLARAAGTDHGYLSNVMNGMRPIPRLGLVRLLADALGMGLEDFIEALEDRASQKLHERLRRREALDEARTQVSSRADRRTAHT